VEFSPDPTLELKIVRDIFIGYLFSFESHVFQMSVRLFILSYFSKQFLALLVNTTQVKIIDLNFKM